MNSAHGPCACAARSRSNATSCSAWWHSRSIKYSASRSSGPRRPERRPLRPREHRENSPRSMNFARGSHDFLITKMPGWLSADEETRNTIISAAERYLRNAEPLVSEWLGTGSYKYSDYAAYRALILLRQNASRGLRWLR